MTEKLDIVQTIAKDAKLSTFARIMGTSGATAWLTRDGDYTVFAPTNDAFAKIPEATLNELIMEPSQPRLKALLSYHILPGRLMAANLPANAHRKSVTGEELTFTDSNGLKVNNAGIQARNLEATNGVIHQIDTVLAPAAAAAATAAGATTLPLSTPPANKVA